MSMTGFDIFDKTVQKANIWLDDLMEIMLLEDKHMAYLALRAALHALRDRLTVEEVAQLGAQLPMLIRGFYYEGWDPTGKPLRVRTQEEFLERIEQEFRGDDRFDSEQVARGVFKLLATQISEGEIEDVKHILPVKIRNLWP